MVKGLVVINLKTYKQGNELLKLVKVIERADSNIIVGAPASEISDLVDKTKLTVYAQHVDAAEPGRNTGFILPEAVKKQGAKGVFLNHSEHPLDFKTIKKTVERCQRLKLKTMVFANDLKQAKRIEGLKPDYIIYEPPELVAGRKSVAEAKPEVIEKIARALKSKMLVGAGIHSREDFVVSIKLGAKGIALSSAVTTANDPMKKLKELLGK